MAVAVPMTNPLTGRTAVGLQGFSWTTLFFGVFPALFRGHFVGFIVMLAVAILTSGLSWLVFPFFYNGWHWNFLIKQGYVPNTLLAGGYPLGARAPSVMQNVVNVHVGAHAAAPGYGSATLESTNGAATTNAGTLPSPTFGVQPPQLTDNRPQAVPLIEHNSDRRS